MQLSTLHEKLANLQTFQVGEETYTIDPKDGRVYRQSDDHFAFIISPGYGADWAHSSSYKKTALFHPFLVWILLNEKKVTAEQIEELMRAIVTNQIVTIGQESLVPVALENKDFHHYCGGWCDASVFFLPRGTKFRTTEYDGSESWETNDSIDWV